LLYPLSYGRWVKTAAERKPPPKMAADWARRCPGEQRNPQVRAELDGSEPFVEVNWVTNG